MSWHTYLSNIDSSSATLIAQLQLEDVIENLQLRLQGPETEGDLDDRLALQIYREELQAFRATHGDIARGADGEETEQVVQEEHVGPSIFDIVVAHTPPSPTVGGPRPLDQTSQDEFPAPARSRRVLLPIFLAAGLLLTIGDSRHSYRQMITNLAGGMYRYAIPDIYYTGMILHPLRTAHRVALRRLPFYGRLHALFQTPVLYLEDECQAVSPTSALASEPSSQDPGSTSSNTHNIPRHLPLRHCNACEEEAAEHDLLYGNMYRTPCAHDFCGTCLIRWSRAMLLDESLFPFRCCVPIPATEILHYLEPRLAAQVVVRTQELGTSERVYCGDPECGAFIPAANPLGVGAGIGVDAVTVQFLTCVRCGRRTCRNCNRLEHGVEECPADTALQAVLELGRTEGWQRCYGCRTLVSLDTGCNHMTCHCEAQFCYLCAAPWKSCPCPQFTEANLVPGGLAEEDDEEADDEDELDDDGFFQIELLRLANGDDDEDDDEEDAVAGVDREAFAGTEVEAEAGPDARVEAEAEVETPSDVEEIPRLPHLLAPAHNDHFGQGNADWGQIRHAGRGWGAHPPEPLDPCRRHRYRFQRIVSVCEMCGFLMPQFCFECRRCRQRVCNRCRGRVEEDMGRGADDADGGRLNQAPRINPWDPTPLAVVERVLGIENPVVQDQRALVLERSVEPGRPALEPGTLPTPAPAPATAVDPAPVPLPLLPSESEPALEAAPAPPAADAALFLPPENGRRFALIPAVLFPHARARRGNIGLDPVVQHTVQNTSQHTAQNTAGENTGIAIEDASGDL